MDEARRQWLERLARAAGRAAEDLRRYEDPSYRELIEDLDRLRDSVTAELGAEASAAPEGSSS